ncbi:hypothetical protein [Rhodococcus sp. HNM0569]|uniref:hypothetical protein n=1 Tax=Rhodococcus sp. HNM0569 TaxID=2716340 RepID=UPI00146E2C52|nr:hypothetical protein [Rhodococcus sp. HNM0569]NLU84410.1 hypothetical protein [Rhodococcus sp. HNM0569]
MNAHTDRLTDYVSAMFAYDFLEGGPDYDAIERIHRGEVGEWTTGLASSGLFTRAEIDRARAAWRRNPRALFDALLVEADEVTVRRCHVSWAALDRVAPLAHAESLARLG